MWMDSLESQVFCSSGVWVNDLRVNENRIAKNQKVENVRMDIVSKFKIQGVKIEKTKSRDEIFSSLVCSESVFSELLQDSHPLKKQIKAKSH
ncbi:Lmo0850 family protein [Pradoshia sp.]